MRAGRALVAWSTCLLTFGLGVLTAGLAAQNRERGDELDRLERWCEAQARRNDLARVANQRREWDLFGPCAAGDPARGQEALP